MMTPVSSFGDYAGTKLMLNDFNPKANGYRGTIRRNVDMARYSWFRTGGCADFLAEPLGEEDLILLLKSWPHFMPVTLIGGGSNILVRDGGIRGLVIHLGKNFQEIERRGNFLVCQAGALDIHIARRAASENLAGLAFLVGIPGTIGGALATNAGAYGGTFSDIFFEASGVGFDGKKHHFSAHDIDFRYRHSSIDPRIIITSVSLEGKPGRSDDITSQMQTIIKDRNMAQPTGVRTGGSTFKNPKGMKAWELIDLAECRGKKLGFAKVSDKHCNFLINQGMATSYDLENLGEKVRADVLAATGVTLEWEIRILGEEKTV